MTPDAYGYGDPIECLTCEAITTPRYLGRGWWLCEVCGCRWSAA